MEHADSETQGRILTVFPLDLVRSETRGLVSKARGLIKAANQAGFVCDCVFLVAGFPVLNPDFAERIGEVGVIARLTSLSYRLPLFLRKLNLETYDAVWIRNPLLNPFWAKTLCMLAAAKLPTYLDIPTYPYTEEAKSIVRKLLYALDQYYRGRVASYVTRYLTLSEHAEIYGIPTIQVSNGCPDNAYLQRELQGPYKLVGVGQWAYWHGLDRLFNGVASMVDSFELTLIGEGPAKRSYAELAQALGLRVRWLGPIHGRALLRELEDADAGIGTLAIHRKGVGRDQSLKHRLYASLGLPFLATTRDETFSESEGVLRMESEESPVASGELLTWLENLRENLSVSEDLYARARGFPWCQAYAPFFEVLASESK